MSAIIHEKHKDRYRIQFCNEKFYLAHQNTFFLWKSRFCELSNVDKLQAWVAGLTCLRRPKDWYGGARQEPIRANFQYQNRLSISDLFSGTEISVPSKLNQQMNLFDLLNTQRIKALPETCFRSLIFMIDGSYPLDIVEGEIEPLELLKIQIKGRRVVALNENVREWPHKLYSARDHLGFILHDLIHADHFFHRPEHRNGQLGFYKLAELISEDQNLKKLMNSEKFKSGFEYIISDMNSHPLHLLKTMHSLLYSELQDDQNAELIWKGWMNKSSASDRQMQSLLKVNGVDFNTDDARNIELLFNSHVV